jgi:ABC-type bacteriocin/lantibiotic exporter with double-glycine peptidase domain
MAGDVVRAWRILDLPERRHAYLVLASLLVGTFLELLSLGLFMPVVSVLASDTFAVDYPWLADLIGTDDELGMTIRVFGLLALVFLLKSIYVAWSIWFQRGFAARIEFRLSRLLFATYAHRPFVFHLDNNSSVLIRNIGMAAQFVSLTIDSLLVLGTDGAVLIAIVAFLIVIEPLGTVVVVAALGVTAMFFHFVTRAKVQDWGNRRVAHEARKLQYLQEGFGAIKEIKVLGREAQFLDRFENEVRQTTKIGRGYGTLTALPRIWLEFLTLLGLAVLVTVLVAQGRSLNDTLPILGVFAAGSFKVMPSMNRIIFAVQNLRYSRSILEMLTADLATSSDFGESPRREVRDLANNIDFCDVRFAYPQSESEAIKGLSFTINAGESVGFVGSSGAGKSTLVDLLLGLLEPTSGRIVVDGNEQRLGDSTSLTIGYVPQTIYLTDDSLRRNVALGVPDAEIDESRLNEALRQASLHEFVSQLPEGLDTNLGERGVRLSGGQRQRIGIARALYLDPSVLVLDEATSSLDILTEEEIVREIASMRGSRTLIVVAHRFSSVSMCHRVHHVEDGRIVQTGSAQEVTNAIESLHRREG